MANENDNEETAIVPLNKAEIEALIPKGPEALLAPVGKDSSSVERRNLIQVPYVAFRGQKSQKNLEALNAAGIHVERDGSGKFYLMDVTPIRVDPFKLHLLQYSRIYTLVDDSGQAVAASFYSDDDLFNAGYRETIYAAAAVVLSPGNYVAATLQLRGANVNALKPAIRLLGDTENPGVAMDAVKFAARGDQWRAAAGVKAPGGRFRLTIWSTADVPQGGGQKFNNGHGSVEPTPAAEVEAFNNWVTHSWPSIQMVMAVNNARFEKARRLALNAADKGEPIPF
jgi:hypothetical protein